MSQIITHDWNGFGIAQTRGQLTIAKFEVPKGYVNATQMCKANGKQWGHYAERKSSKAYWEGLANDIGIPISSLIIQVDAYGNEQATWVHPEIAIDLAQWVNIPFKIWANRTLLKVMTSETEQPKLPPLSHENQLRLLELSQGLLQLRYDERLAMAASAALKNLLEGTAKQSDEPKLLSVTEWLGTVGYRVPKGKDSVLGRKIAARWRSQHDCDPQVAPKYVGTNHETKIKVYPQDFLSVIIEVTEEYCQVKLS